MKAVVFDAPGAPDVLQLREVVTPELVSPTAIKVRLKAAGVNPIDTKLRSRGTYAPDQMPAILGCDGAGVVEAIGAAVTDFEIGDAVLFNNGGIGITPGNYAEYAVVEQALAAPIPEGMGFAEAAAAPLVLITAWESLFDCANVNEHSTVLIQAGAGGVGHVAIQLAKAAGARVITTVEGADKAEFVAAIGADEVIDYRQQDVVAECLRLTDGAGVDVAFDTVGGAVLNQCFAATRIYGDVVSLLQPDANTDWKTMRLRNQRLGLELMLTPMHLGLDEALAHHGEILRQCMDLYGNAQLRVCVSRQFSLAEAAAAHRLIEAGGMLGKAVLLVD